jgi:hypothetical protein
MSRNTATVVFRVGELQDKQTPPRLRLIGGEETMASRWPIEDVGLEEISLDLRNVRIPNRDLDESAIASYLVEAEDLLELARDILRDGYLDNELPVVTDENGRRVVLEGNRRITALKAIHDSALLGTFAPRMERLLSRYPEAEMPTEVRVMVAPSREAAQQLLARLHTRNPKKSWLREQQAVFYHAQLSRMSFDQLRTLYPGLAPSVLASFIRMGEMRAVIRGLRYEDRELAEFVKSSRLKMTSFEYAYERPKIQDALGLKFKKDGLLASRRMSVGQRRGLMYLLERFKAGTLNTRSPELKAKSNEHEPFVDLLRRVVAGGADATTAEDREDAGPGGAEESGQPGSGAAAAHNGVGTGNETNGAGRSGAAGTGASSGSNGAPQAGSRGPNRGETRSRLNMDGFVYQGSSAGLRRRFEELRRLDVREFPNAAHDLLRTLLECAIKVHFAAKGQPLPTDSMLRYCVAELAGAYQSDQRMTSLINAINRRGRMQADQFPGTALALNASNHEPDSFVTGPDVHQAWERIKPILIEIVG